MSNSQLSHAFPYLGHGIGLRPPHYKTLLETKPTEIDWFECITEDYLDTGGRHWHYLTQLREHYPMVMHGVSLSIGSVDPLNYSYLKQVKTLAEKIEPAWISDHVCWTGVNGLNMHDLLPLPYTQEALDHVASRVSEVQDFLERPLVLENPSTYITYKDSSMPEWEFLAALSKKTGCYVLLDINNIHVTAFNSGFDPQEYLQGIPVGVVKQFHLAGHKKFRTHIIDTHDEPIIKKVWALYEEALKRFGPVSTLIERDDNIPPVEELLIELDQAKKIAKKVLS